MLKIIGERRHEKRYFEESLLSLTNVSEVVFQEAKQCHPVTSFRNCIAELETAIVASKAFLEEAEQMQLKAYFGECVSKIEAAISHVS